MKSYNIAVIGGDGTGPEVVHEAIKVLDAAAPKYGVKLNYLHYDFGGDRYLRTGEVLPASAIPEYENNFEQYLKAYHPDHLAIYYYAHNNEDPERVHAITRRLMKKYLDPVGD